MPVTWERRSTEPAVEQDTYRSLTRVQSTPCYDFLFSLGALYNTRMFENARAWARSARASLSAETYELGRFFFKRNQALGYGAARLVLDLPDGAPPELLLQAVRECDPATFAEYLMDTGETTEETLEGVRHYLRQRSRRADLDRLLHSLPAESAQHCRRVLLDPSAARADFARLLEEYLAAVFASELGYLSAPLEHAATQARDMLAVLKTTEAIERLSGGYTLAPDLPLGRITVASSAFIYPFMFTRVDVSAGEALVVYGVSSERLRKHEPAPTDAQLARVMRALADPNRQTLISLLAQRPMFGPELVTALGLSQPTVHHHLAQLRAVRLVRQERVSGGMRYTLRDDTAAQAIDSLRRLFAGAAHTDANASTIDIHR
jgi:DNA-binding transcriptional ArsR family regulator